MALSPVSVLALATAVPPHRLEQSAVADAARRIYAKSIARYPKLVDVFLNAGIERRYSVRPLEWFMTPHGWSERNDAYLDGAGDLFVEAARSALARAGLAAAETRPFDKQSPMVLEAQLDRQHGIERRGVTAYLASHRPRGKLLASFASLSHYVQELSNEGFVVRDFVHEGNGELWAAATAHPARHVDGILIEELAEGGDELARRARGDPTFLEGFRRVAEGGGVALYQRIEAAD
jgi:hypothetical protein